MGKRKTALLTFAILMSGFSLACLLPGHTDATTGVNQELSFEGKIVTAAGLNITDGTYNTEFNIYTGCTNEPTSSTGCTSVWTEDWLVHNSQGVTFTSGTFQANLGSITSLPTNIWNTYPLYLSIQIGDTTNHAGNCVGSANFTTNCGGDGVMNPYILLTSTPYALNSNQLGGLTASQFGQLATGQTWTAANVIQPTSDVTGLKVQQSNAGSPAADIFDVQNNAGTSNIIQATAAGALSLSTIGTTQTLSLATAASTAASTGAITIQSGSASSGSNLSAGTVTIDTGTKTGAGTATINLGTTNATALNLATASGVAQTIAIGSTNAGTTVTSTAGATKQTLANSGATVQTTTNSTTALQVQNSSGSNVINVDTTGSNQNNLITNPSIESAANIGNAGDWQKRSGSETTFAQDTTQQFIGKASLKVTTSAAAGDGAKQNVTLTNGQTYTISFDAKLDAASNSFATMQVGYAYNGADITTLVSPSYTVISNGWTRYSYTFTQNQTNSSTPYIFIKQTDATIHTFYIDAVTVQTDANADNNYREGKIQLGGTITSPVILQNAANSTTALQVEDTAGAAVLTVDTTDTNLIGNPGAEVNAAGWAGKGTNGTIIRDTSQQKYGQASFKLTGSAANDGAAYTFASSLPVGTYSVGLSVKITGNAFPANTLVFGLTNGSGDNNCTSITPAVTATVPSSGGWTSFSSLSCTIATTAATAFYVKQTDATSHAGANAYWIDGIELDNSATLTPYGLGAISLNGVVKTPLTLQNQSNSTSALTLQDSGTNVLFQADTLNDIVNIGSTGSQALASTVNIASTSGAAIQTVNIGSNSNVANVTNIFGGNGTAAIALTPQTTGTIVIGAAAGTGNITLGSSSTTQTTIIGGGGGVSTVQIAGGTAANVVQVANAQTAGSVTIGNTMTSGTISIGGGAAVRTGDITIGSTGTTSGRLRLIGGTGTGAFGGATSGIDIIPGVAGTINIGASGGAGTGAITIGQSTASQTINIANGVTGAGNTKTVNIGTAQNASTGVTAINIGLNNTSTGANTVTIKAGGSGRSQGPSVTLGNVATQSNAVCSSLANNTAPTAGTAYELEDCNVAPAIDYAEYYPTDGTSTYGDIMALGPQTVQEYDTDGQGNILYNAPKRIVSKLVKAAEPYQAGVIGVVSNNYDMFTSTGLGIVSAADNPMPVALNGRIPVNISPDSAPIAPGDYITTSSDPGKGMKATQAGEVIGKALAAWQPGSGETQIMVFVEQGYYPGPAPSQTIQNGSDASLTSLVVNGNTALANLSVSGDASFTNLNASGTAAVQNLTVSGAASVQTLSVSGSLSAATLQVAGLAQVAQLQVDGGINLGGANEDPTLGIAHPITERFKASKPIPAGAVVIIDVNPGYVTTTAKAGDMRVAGVAVTAAVNPGDVIEVAIGGTAKVMISGSAAVGDLLQTDATEGKAGAVSKPAPGEIVGKVLSQTDQNGQAMALITLE